MPVEEGSLLLLDAVAAYFSLQHAFQGLRENVILVNRAVALRRKEVPIVTLTGRIRGPGKIAS